LTSEFMGKPQSDNKKTLQVIVKKHCDIEFNKCLIKLFKKKNMVLSKKKKKDS